MDKGIKRVKEIVVKDIKNYRETCNFIETLCKKYFEKEYDINWQHFSDWDFDDNIENVIINYSYLDYNNEWEYNSIHISLDKLIEMM